MRRNLYLMLPLTALAAFSLAAACATDDEGGPVTSAGGSNAQAGMGPEPMSQAGAPAPAAGGKPATGPAGSEGGNEAFYGGAPPIWYTGPDGDYPDCGAPDQPCCETKKCDGFGCCSGGVCVRVGWSCGEGLGLCDQRHCGNCGDVEQPCCQGSCVNYATCNDEDACVQCGADTLCE